MAEQEAKMTLSLLLSIFFTVFGNSFLYGYNIGDVNNPAPVIREFYARVLLERKEIFPLAELSPNQSAVFFADLAKGADYDANSSSASAMTSLSNMSLEQIEVQIVKKMVDNEPVIEILWSITVAIFVLFGMIGAFVSGSMADHFGRKKSMLMITVLMFLAALFGGIPIVTGSFEMLIVHRALVGLHCGINISLASMYLAEISPRSIRGAVGTCHQLFITIGILWSNIMGVSKLCGTVDLWPWVFIFNAIPAAVCLIGLPFCPESPRYMLIKQGKEEEARDALKRLRGYSDVEEEIDEMKVEARKSQSVESFSIKKLLTTPDLRIPVIMACVLQVSQQWSGINAVMSFSSFMYKNAGVPENVVEWVVCGTSTINVLTTIVAVPLMEKLGRRPLMIYPMIGMALSFIVLTIFHNLQNDMSLADNHKAFAYVGIAAMHTYVIGFALGLGPIPFIIVSEIFRQEPRAAAMSISLAFNWVCNFTLMLVFRFMQDAMQGYVYLPFIVILALAVVFITIMVPETKNRTFDEIAAQIGIGRGKKGLTYDQEEGQELNSMKT
ncbi:solute carrier family 2, facilitated glucose transporter member 1-like [Ylistrum balloti]|uniref:solute carrier family 2, facilitated glucose transporter member 1-like n=1 Tax=Ylistrum balloti TaxID=509963 RepID=UPI002905ED61|nr:solute carrier family 2, facilitated glucose transporter member 1-like [Ylistrum balloti]